MTQSRESCYRSTKQTKTRKEFGGQKNNWVGRKEIARRAERAPHEGLGDVLPRTEPREPYSWMVTEHRLLKWDWVWADV